MPKTVAKATCVSTFTRLVGPEVRQDEVTFVSPGTIFHEIKMPADYYEVLGQPEVVMVEATIYG